MRNVYIMRYIKTIPEVPYGNTITTIFCSRCTKVGFLFCFLSFLLFIIKVSSISCLSCFLFITISIKGVSIKMFLSCFSHACTKGMPAIHYFPYSVKHYTIFLRGAAISSAFISFTFFTRLPTTTCVYLSW